VEHRIVGISTECFFYRLQVRLVNVSRDLWASYDSRSTVTHEVCRASCRAASNEIRDAELRICIDVRPRPHITPSSLFLFKTDVLYLCTAKCPYFVALETANGQALYVLIMVLRADSGEINQEFYYRILSNSRHPNCRRMELPSTSEAATRVFCSIVSRFT
jgi:hypothetical protein